MKPRVGRSPGLVSVLAALAVLGCNLPSGGAGKTPLTLRFLGPDTVLMSDTTVLEVEARDPTGRVLAEPPLQWSYIHGPDSDAVEVLRSEFGKAWVVGTYPSIAHLQVSVPADNPSFTSPVLDFIPLVLYGPMTVRFLDVGNDLSLTKRGPFSLRVSALDERGRAPQFGTYQVTSRTGSISVGGIGRVTSGDTSWGSVSLVADSLRADTLIATNTACSNACADTLAVRVEPVPRLLGFPPGTQGASSLNDTVQLVGTVRDSAGYAIPDASVTWELVRPADSVILRLLDPSAGTAVTVSNGTARVRARSGALQAETDFVVAQGAATVRLQVPPHIVGVGTTFTTAFTALDAGGTVVPASRLPNHRWTSRTPSVVAEVYDSAFVTQDFGSAVLNLHLYVCCPQVGGNGTVHVIHEPDSVRAYPRSGSTTIARIGGASRWLGDIYLPDTTISGSRLFWTSLDPGVATIDFDGLVTGVAPGSARIVGTMGAAADTSIVTVSGGGP